MPRVPALGLVFAALLLAFAAGLPGIALAQLDADIFDIPCCEKFPQVIWYGADSLLTMERVAAYAAPVLWFSPDEPLLDKVRHPEDIRIPEAFPFQEQADRPVVYYRIRSILTTTDEGRVFRPDSTDLNLSTINISRTTAIDIDYYFYYPWEAGMGTHKHDVESVQMKLLVARQSNCPQCPLVMGITKVVAKAHGLKWYDNTLNCDEYTEFPIHILVEEGKHASCTDKNQDGLYSPGYDVNVRTNDAWGVRDVIRTGSLFTAGYQSWLSKVRVPEDRIFPPLPEDSPVRNDVEEEFGVAYAEGYAVYELRPFPVPEAAAEDPSLVPFIEDKPPHQWPVVEEQTNLNEVSSWLEEDDIIKSLSVAFRYDTEAGISLAFPLLIVHNVEAPVIGGWLVNRVYFEGPDLSQIFGWNILLTPSASRFMDVYFSAGIRDEKLDSGSRTGFETELGVKFRANVAHSPLKFMSKLTDFWGVRGGFRYVGFSEFSQLGYVIEVGAGVW